MLHKPPSKDCSDDELYYQEWVHLYGGGQECPSLDWDDFLSMKIEQANQMKGWASKKVTAKKVQSLSPEMQAAHDSIQAHLKYQEYRRILDKEGYGGSQMEFPFVFWEVSRKYV